MTSTFLKKIILGGVLLAALFDIGLLFAASNNNQLTDAMSVDGPSSVVPMGNPDNNVMPANNSVASSAATKLTSAPLTQAGGIAQLAAQQPSADQQSAFMGAIDKSMPMTPSQILELKQRVAAAEQAAATSAGTPPQPVSTSMMVSLAPGATPPVIRLQQGFISSLVITDSSGNPWPITAIDNGNSTAFNVSWNKSGNTIMIQALKAYTSGNIAVSLKGSDTPVMLTLIPGQNVVDYRADLRVAGLSPDSAKGVMDNGLPPSANQELLQVLDGIGPQNSQVLSIEGCSSCGAWATKTEMYVRLPEGMNLISPGFLGMMKSPDGTQVYDLRKAPTLLIADNAGTTSEKKVKGLQ